MQLTDENKDRLQKIKDGSRQLAETSEGTTRKPFRLDGYVNMLNKYGTAQDNSTAYSYVAENLIPDETLTTQYESNGLFAKIIDIPAQEAVKKGFKLNIADEQVEEYVQKRIKDLAWSANAELGLKWSRLYGGAIGVMILNDGSNDLSQPVNWKKVKGIEEIVIYDRSCVTPDYHSLYNNYGVNYEENRRRSKFRQPQFFNVFSIYGNFRVHESRCLVFRNGIMPEKASSMEYRFWGAPEYARIKRALREAITAHGYSVRLLERCVQAVYKMKDLSQLLATDEGEDQVIRRLQTIDMARGILNSITIDTDGEDYDFRSVSLTGVKEVIESACNMLSAITEIPQTKLFGRSPAGMNATGEGDLENYYNFIDKIRETQLTDNLRTLVDVIIQIGVNRGELTGKPEYELEFESLWNESETERATIDQTNAQTKQVKAQTAQLYVDMGVLDPAEVRKQLKEDGEYGIEDETLPEQENPLADLIAQQTQQPLQKDGRLDEGWKESDHPRDENGQFTSGGGSSSASSNGKPPKNFSNNMEQYIGGGYDLSDVLDDEDFSYIQNNLEETSKPLYRVEEGNFTASDIEEEHQRFSFNGKMRSFTRSEDVMKSFLDEDADVDFDNPALFVTVGKTKHFNATPYAQSYAKYGGDQEESLVGGEFEVVKSEYKRIGGRDVPVYYIKQIDSRIDSAERHNVDSVGVIVFQNGKILVGERSDSGEICGAGGHIENWEDALGAAQRETEEEFGIIVTDLIPLGAIEGLDEQYGKPFVFLANGFSGAPLTDTQEMRNNRFVRLQELVNSNLFEPFRQSLSLLFEQLGLNDAGSEFSKNFGKIHEKGFTSVGNNAIMNNKETETDGEWKENDHPRDESGRFTSGSGGSAVVKETASESEKVVNEPTAQNYSFGGRTSAEFANDLQSAKSTVSVEKAWRVTAHTKEELDSEYRGATLHTTKGGSTVAVTTDGDIVSVCRKQGDTQRGSDLLKLAVENGGKKLDSYSGNHDFYTRNGFEPISWCEWNDDYAPAGWSAERDSREPIIFYKYTGKQTTESAADFMVRVKASSDYATAQKIRDKEIGG